MRFQTTEDELVELHRFVSRYERRAGLPPAVEVWRAGEIYLELEALDLNDEEAVLVFANRHGVLGISTDDFRVVRDLPWYSSVTDHLRSVQPSLSIGINPLYGGSARVTAIESLAEFQFAARVLRDLRAAYVALQAGGGHEMAWQSVPEFEYTELERGGASLTLPGGVTEVLARRNPDRVIGRYFEFTLSAGLAGFVPSVRVTATLRGPIHGWMSGATVPLYASCCLELHNHVMEAIPYRRCEHCQRLFVRHKGRAEHNQHRRSGVKYCSALCARAAAQHAYRERKRKLAG